MSGKPNITNLTCKWMSGMNSMPKSMFTTLYNTDKEKWKEVTAPKKGATVFIKDLERCGEIVEVCNTDHFNKIYIIRLDNGQEFKTQSRHDFKMLNNSLPESDIIWSFGEDEDDYWLSELDGVQPMSDCGFRVFYHEEWGYFFGIEKTDCDYYFEHWVPLYKIKNGVKSNGK